MTFVQAPLVLGMQDKKTYIEYTFDKGKFLIKIDIKPNERHSRAMQAYLHKKKQ